MRTLSYGFGAEFLIPVKSVPPASKSISPAAAKIVLPGMKSVAHLQAGHHHTDHSKLSCFGSKDICGFKGTDDLKPSHVQVRNLSKAPYTHNEKTHIPEAISHAQTVHKGHFSKAPNLRNSGALPNFTSSTINSLTSPKASQKATRTPPRPTVNNHDSKGSKAAKPLDPTDIEEMLKHAQERFSRFQFGRLSDQDTSYEQRRKADLKANVAKFRERCRAQENAEKDQSHSAYGEEPVRARLQTSSDGKSQVYGDKRTSLSYLDSASAPEPLGNPERLNSFCSFLQSQGGDDWMNQAFLGDSSSDSSFGLSQELKDPSPVSGGSGDSDEYGLKLFDDIFDGKNAKGDGDRLRERKELRKGSFRGGNLNLYSHNQMLF